MIRTYSELMLIPTFEERLEYLKIHGKIGGETFGDDRYLNQLFYSSGFWKTIRNKIIIRDNGCDLGITDREIPGRIIIHHMNPLLLDDIVNASEIAINPEYLICVSDNTHKAIHYDVSISMPSILVERKPYDQSPWRKNND